MGFPVVLMAVLAFASSQGQPIEAQPAAAPRVVRAVAPDYPEVPTLIVGYVWVDATIDSSGAVTAAKIVRTPVFLDKEPLRAARLWRFEPAPGTSNRTARLTFVFDQVRQPKAKEELYPAFVPPYTVVVKTKCTRHCDTLDKTREGVFPPGYDPR